jgi:hypothetical protein
MQPKCLRRHRAASEFGHIAKDSDYLSKNNTSHAEHLQLVVWKINCMFL